MKTKKIENYILEQSKFGFKNLNKNEITRLKLFYELFVSIVSIQKIKLGHSF